MSAEEETELRDMVAQALELNGCLPKIRAELRANLFLCLDESPKLNQKQPLMNNKVKSQLSTPEGRLMFSLVKEFLENLNLDFTMSVYDAESYLDTNYKYEGRKKILEDLGLPEENCSEPLLLQLIKTIQKKAKTLSINLNNFNKTETTEETVSSQQVLTNGIEEKNTNENHTVNGSEHKEEPNKPIVNSFQDNDDTFNGTSSIEEESVCNSDSEQKIAQKHDTKNKLKPELSPLGKARGDILPSLYNKEPKEKTARSGAESEFEIREDYEEDFVSGSETEFSLSKVDCPTPLLEELQEPGDQTFLINTSNPTESKEISENGLSKSD